MLTIKLVCNINKLIVSSISIYISVYSVLRLPNPSFHLPGFSPFPGCKLRSDTALILSNFDFPAGLLQKCISNANRWRSRFNLLPCFAPYRTMFFKTELYRVFHWKTKISQNTISECSENVQL